MISNRFSTENLQVGDKVVVCYSCYSSRARYIGEIIKKTPTGMVDVKYGSNFNTTRFRANGSTYEKRDIWYDAHYWIEFATEEVIKEIKSEASRRSLVEYLSEFDYKLLTVEELTEIYNKIPNRFREV